MATTEKIKALKKEIALRKRFLKSTRTFIDDKMWNYAHNSEDIHVDRLFNESGIEFDIDYALDSSMVNVIVILEDALETFERAIHAMETALDDNT